jgi:hypothetical protein
MRKLTIILLCGIIATAANAGTFGRRAGEGPKDNKTNTPAAAVTTRASAPATPAVTSAPRAAAPSFGRPSPVGYTPPAAYNRAPAAQTPRDTGARGGFASYRAPGSSAVVSSPAPVPVSQGSRGNGYRSGNSSSDRGNAPGGQANVHSSQPAPVTRGSGNAGNRIGGSTRSSGPTTITGYTPTTSNRDRGNASGGQANVHSSQSAPVTHGSDNTGGRFGGSVRSNPPTTMTGYTPGTGSRDRGNASGGSIRPGGPATITGYTPTTSNRDRGNAPGGQAGAHYSQPLPVTHGSGNTGNRIGGSTRSSGPATITGYTPTARNRESGRPAGTVDRTPRRSGDASATPGHGSPGTGYRPGNQSHLPGDIPHTVNRNSGNHGSFGGDRNTTAGYAPHRSNYTVGYHPTRFSMPHGYTPPTYRQGRYYYPATYHPKPCFFGYWAPIYSPGFSYRSVYFSFGLFPYVQIDRISECSYTSISYSSEPIYVSGTYYHNARYSQLDEALADIRSGWISGRYDLIGQHVRAGQTIAVLLDGQYDYSISSDDYLSMTRDAIADLNTATFVWDKVRERGDGTVTAFGEHAYISSDQTRTVYVSYTLEKVGRDYFITEVGSSQDPLE